MSSADLLERDEHNRLLADKSARVHAEGARRFRNVALLYASLSIVGGHFTKHALGPLKPYFINDLNYTNTEFGIFLASPSFPNLVLPVLSGIFIDHTGYERGSILFTMLALIGNIIFTIAVVKKWFATAIVGRIIFGIGESGSGIVQSALILAWFRMSSLNFAIGIGEGAIYLSGFGGKIIPSIIIGYSMQKLAERQEKLQSQGLASTPLASGIQNPAVLGLCVCTFFLFVSAITSIVFYFLSIRRRPFVFALSKKPSGVKGSGKAGYDTIVPSSASQMTIEDNALREKDDLLVGSEVDIVNPATTHAAIDRTNRATVRDILTFPIVFWLLGLLHTMFANVYNLFGGISTDLIVERSHGEYTVESAAMLASIDAALPVVLAPLIGLYVDRYGELFSFLIASGPPNLTRHRWTTVDMPYGGVQLLPRLCPVACSHRGRRISKIHSRDISAAVLGVHEHDADADQVGNDHHHPTEVCRVCSGFVRCFVLLWRNIRPHHPRRSAGQFPDQVLRARPGLPPLYIHPAHHRVPHHDPSFIAFAQVHVSIQVATTRQTQPQPSCRPLDSSRHTPRKRFDIKRAIR